MQMPLASTGRVRHCRSLSASDIQFYVRRHFRNCCHEQHVPVNSCSENASNEQAQKAATRLFSANDADEMVCTCRQRNTEPVTVHMPSRPMSSHVVVTQFHNECHCVACCSCSPCDRRSGNCPAFTFPVRTLSVQRALSVDSGLTICHSCSRRLSAANDSNNPDLVRNSAQEYDPVIHKSSSVPACCSSQMRYYTAGISFDSLNNDTCQACNTGVFSTSPSDSSPTRDDTKSVGIVDQSAVSPDEDSALPVGMLSVFGNTEVSPVEYHRRFQTVTSWFKEFDDEQKNILLLQLLNNCWQPQIHMLSTELSSRLHEGCPHNCQDRLGWLPDVMSFHILSYLDPVSLCRCLSVCQRWRQLASDSFLWRQLCSRPKWRLSQAAEQKQLLRFLLPDGSINWKGIFAERFRLRRNWLKGRCNVRTFEGHTQGISCVQFDDTRIVSGSSDKTIKLWNIRTNSPWAVQTLVGHSGTVRCLYLEGNRLVSGSTDHTIKVWDLSSQQSWTSIACKVTMVGHCDTVRCLQVDDEKVVSGSYDKTLKVWDIRTGQCQRTLRGHDAAVLCVQFDTDKIISGSCDKTIKVWTFSGECLKTLHGHQDAVTCLQFDDRRIVSGSIDCTLRFWDLHSQRSVKVIDWKASEGHTGVIRCLQADSWRVVSASDDRTIKVWSLATGQRLVTLRNHTDGVTCLQFSDSVIVSGSYDKTVKLWDFSCC